MRRFGQVIRCRIPQDERGRNRGMAIVVFKEIANAERALAEGEVTVDLSTLMIEVATKSVRPSEVSQQDRNALRNLTRQRN